METQLDYNCERRYLRGVFCDVMPLVVEKAKERLANDAQLSGEPEGQALFTLQSAQQNCGPRPIVMVAALIRGDERDQRGDGQ